MANIGNPLCIKQSDVMLLYTNENNTSALKVLIAAKLAGRKLDIKIASFSERIVSVPRQLPLLIVIEDLSFFSSNAAVSYLLPFADTSQNTKCLELLEWEANRLDAATHCAASDRASTELQVSLSVLLQQLDAQVKSAHEFLCGDKISAADIAIWCTLYRLHNVDKLREKYFAQFNNLKTWYDALAKENVVQLAVGEWGGRLPASDTSCLGAVVAPTVASPGADERAPAALSPDELAVAADAWCAGTVPSAIPAEKVVLPVKGRRNVLITSALPYVNNVPHLGNIIGCVLSADIFARYCRCAGYNTLFVSGTDEYGTATETKALEENLSPRQICDKYFAIHNEVYRWFNIGFDCFGRTSTPEQTEITQQMFSKLNENGFITSQSVDQLLCKSCSRFLADRFVEGTCPHAGCGYEDARGDQCDKCGKLVNATELIDARCKICGARPETTQSPQLFLQLPQLEPALRTWFGRREASWSGSARAVARAWFRDGLRARCITRDLKWGVPVPLDGFRDKVFYVWFDAPIGYMSITKRYTADYEKWWRPDPAFEVKLYQFMAKDNVPFHSVIFPATLMGVNERHALVDHIFATEYLNYEEGKFSKSRGVGVFGTDAQSTGIPADVWRFYLASVRPEAQDASFSWCELGARNNSELLNNLGNFCHRSLSFCWSSFGGVVPPAALQPHHLELVALVNREIAAYVETMERGRLREALKHVLAVSRLGNGHMQAEQPWVLLKGSDQDKARGATTIALNCNLAALLAVLLAPYTPDASVRLCRQLNLDRTQLRLDASAPKLVQYLPAGHVIAQPEPLFARLEPARLEQLRAQFAGTQAQRHTNGVAAAHDLEAAVAQQAEIVRQLKARSKDKAAWTPEVNKLLQLKKQLVEAQQRAPAATPATPDGGATQLVESLTAAVAEQGEKVRQLKASTKDKAAWTPEVNRLIDLKKQLAAASAQPRAPSAEEVDRLAAAVAEQGEKVRQLKAQTKDKAVWTPEVNKLLELKKQLALLQIQK